MGTTSYEQLAALHRQQSPYTVAVRVIETLQLISWGIRRLLSNAFSREQYEMSYLLFDAWLLAHASDMRNAECIFQDLMQAFTREEAYQSHIRLVQSILHDIEALDGKHEAYNEQATLAVSLLK
jgi:hypothetical protein